MWLYLFYFLACFCCVEVSELVSVTHLVFDAWAHTHTHLTHTSLDFTRRERESFFLFFFSCFSSTNSPDMKKRDKKEHNWLWCVCMLICVHRSVESCEHKKRGSFFFSRLLCCLVVFFFLSCICVAIVLLLWLLLLLLLLWLLAYLQSNVTHLRGEGKKKKRNAGLLKLPHFLESRFETWDLIVALKKLTRWRKCGFPDLVHIRSLSFFLFGQFLNSHCGGGLTVLL